MNQGPPAPTPRPAPLFQRRAVLALAWRGVRGSFESPAAYVALFVFYLLAGYLFVYPLFLMGQASLKGLLDLAPLLLAFLVPALSMGLLAEELKSGTFEALACLPLEDWDVVLGKFLGLAGVLAAAVGGLSFFPAVLSLLAAPPAGLDWGEVAGVLSGLMLLGLHYGAMGLLASSLSRSQVVSFITAFLLAFFFYAAGKFAPFFPGPLGPLAEFIGVDSHLDTLAKGVFDTRDLLYFASLIFGFLFLTVERLHARRS